MPHIFDEEGSNEEHFDDFDISELSQDTLDFMARCMGFKGEYVQNDGSAYKSFTKTNKEASNADQTYANKIADEVSILNNNRSNDSKASTSKPVEHQKIRDHKIPQNILKTQNRRISNAPGYNNRIHKEYGSILNIKSFEDSKAVTSKPAEEDRDKIGYSKIPEHLLKTQIRRIPDARGYNKPIPKAYESILTIPCFEDRKVSTSKHAEPEKDKIGNSKIPENILKTQSRGIRGAPGYNSPIHKEFGSSQFDCDNPSKKKINPTKMTLNDMESLLENLKRFNICAKQYQHAKKDEEPRVSIPKLSQRTTEGDNEIVTSSRNPFRPSGTSPERRNEVGPHWDSYSSPKSNNQRQLYSPREFGDREFQRWGRDVSFSRHKRLRPLQDFEHGGYEPRGTYGGYGANREFDHGYGRREVYYGEKYRSPDSYGPFIQRERLQSYDYGRGRQYDSSNCHSSEGRRGSYGDRAGCCGCCCCCHGRCCGRGSGERGGWGGDRRGPGGRADRDDQDHSADSVDRAEKNYRDRRSESPCFAAQRETPEKIIKCVNENRDDDPLYCVVCKVGVSSAAHMDAHLKGSPHNRKLKQFGFDATTPLAEAAKAINSLENAGEYLKYRTSTGAFYCQKCKKEINHITALKLHLNGKKHKMKH